MQNIRIPEVRCFYFSILFEQVTKTVSVEVWHSNKIYTRVLITLWHPWE